MTDPAPEKFSVLLLGKQLARFAAAVAAVFILYTEGANAFLNTQDAIKAKAVADNAAVRQKGEAVQAEQQARTQLEIARNAAERQSADADKAEAEARKAEAQAIIADQEAHNAELKAVSEARAFRSEANIRQSKAITELELARVAARQFKADAEIIEEKNKKSESNQNYYLKGNAGRVPEHTPSLKDQRPGRRTLLMPDLPQTSRFRDLPTGLIKNKWLQILAALFALLELYNHGTIPAYINTQKAIEARATAENAALRQKGEALIQEWKAVNETQIAKYAERKQTAEAARPRLTPGPRRHRKPFARDGKGFRNKSQGRS